MKSTHQFDVLVVYNQRLATSASLNTVSETTPFSRLNGMSQHNDAYSFFLESCRKNKISAAFTTTADSIKNGVFKSYWEYSDNKWFQTVGNCYAKLVFDKFSPLGIYSPNTKSLFSSDTGVRPFNDSVLHELFDDKFKTYKRLPQYVIPTVEIADASRPAISNALRELKALVSVHPNSNDFTNSLILKDRFGAGGENIFKIDNDYTKKIHSTMDSKRNNSFVLQPFMKFDKGYSYKNNGFSTDIRIIYLQGKIVQTYIRTAKEDDFRCNEHQGGTVKYLTEKDIPELVIETGKKIIKTLNRNNALYTLDFIVSNNGNAYLLEGNIKPGIYWGKDQKEDEKMTKRLTEIIVKECKRKIDKRKYELDDLIITSNAGGVPIHPVVI